MEKINRLNITQHLLEYELGMVGKTMLDVLDDDRWYFNITMTSKQYAEFRNYAIPLLQKIFKFNKRKALSTFSWFDLMFGLRIKD